jgi:hypothetical protein
VAGTLLAGAAAAQASGVERVRTSGRQREPGRRARAARAEREPTGWRPAIDTSRYQWTVGVIGLALVIAFSIYLNVSGAARSGIAPGGRLQRFVAPLAGSGIDRPANADPRCNPSRPNREGLNVCGRTPLVLAFFVTDAGQCVGEVRTLQRLAPRFPGIQFAAVAVRGSPGATTALARARQWTIPVAYDEDGRIGEIYGVETCPMIYLVHRGGRVAARLIGGRWVSPPRLAAQVRHLLGTSAGRHGRDT